MIKFLIATIFLILVSDIVAIESNKNPSKEDSLRKAKKLLEEASVQSSQQEIKMTIRNVDISNYPMIKLIVEAYNIYSEPLDTLVATDISVIENGEEKKILSIEKISIDERIPVDFCFVIDQTGSMQSYIDGLQKRMMNFTQTLHSRGIDYSLSLVLFSDKVENYFQPTESVGVFQGWLREVEAKGGGDLKENALESMAYASKYINFRPSANKVIVLITDAPYHQKGENGNGKTEYNTQSITDFLNKNEIRVFGITTSKVAAYKEISKKTRGNNYDMDYPFSAILDNFSNQLTNLYAVKYKTSEPAIPDSIDVGIVDNKKRILTKKTIPIVELGRKLIIKNMLFKTGMSKLPGRVPELDVLTEFMTNRQNVVIMVEGHTDAIGSHAVNDRLSKQRAEVVKRYLVDKGIQSSRIKTVGYGERRPIASNKSDWGRSLNRRTEIRIIAK